MITDLQKLKIDFLKGILKDICADEYLSQYLVFKGGTSLILFYGLPRFSEDLDFSLLPGFSKEKIDNRVNAVLRKHNVEILNITNNKSLSVGKKGDYKINGYDETFRLKVEISNRAYITPIKSVIAKLNDGEKGEFPVRLLAPEQNFAHKICAFLDRNEGRDTFDLYFYLKNWFEIDDDIIKERFGYGWQEALLECVTILSKPENRAIYLRKLIPLTSDDFFLKGEYFEPLLTEIENRLFGKK